MSAIQRFVCLRCLTRPRPFLTAQFRLSSTVNSSSTATSTTSTSNIPAKDPLVPAALVRKARALSSEHAALQAQLETGYSSAAARKAGALERVKAALDEYQAGIAEVGELREMLADGDAEMRGLARAEMVGAVERAEERGRELVRALVPVHPFAHLPAIVEVRPGTGGSEAVLFAGELVRMYRSYARNRGWAVSVISLEHGGEEGGGEQGVSEAVFSVDEDGAYDALRLEAGVHRVQRVPVTETKGRVHTSTASVLVLPLFPEASSSADDDPDSHIRKEDVKIEVMRAGGAGGQHVNRTESAVRMTHVPTGIVAAVQETRSQLKNREKAWAVLRARVAELRRREREERELAERRRVMGGKVGAGGERSDKVRTYNFSQNRVTDHRAGKTVHDVEGVLSGGPVLEEMMEAVRTWRMEVDVEMLGAEADAQVAGKK